MIAPAGLEIPVGEAVIYDPADPPTLERGAVILGVGIAADTADVSDIVKKAGVADAAAIVLKLDGGPSIELLDACEQARLALLRIPFEMSWGQAHSLWRTAVTGASAGEPTTTEFPLGDLFALANAVAAMVGGPVTIEDRYSRVLAYSSQDQADEPRRQTILGRRVPEEWRDRLEEAGVFRRLWAGEVVRYQAAPGVDLRPRLAIAVRAGETILGSIWVAEGERPLDDLAEGAVREAARIAALHLLRHRAADDLDRNQRGELLRAILEGRGSLRALAHQLAVTANGTFAVIAFEPQVVDEVEGALERERTLDLVALYGEAFRQRSASVQLGRTIYVLLPGPDPARPERLVELARDISGRARESLNAELRAGVGSIVPHLRDVPRSRREADDVLRALTSGDGPDVADFEGARVRISLLELEDYLSERPELRSRRLDTLREHDRAYGTDYIPTLRAYLDSFGDIPRAARCANVHSNTFRYRLRRLVELSGIDLDDPDERLVVQLELRLGADEGATE